MAKKAFNLEEYKAHPDWKVETGKGENVRILTTDMKSDFPILAIIEDSPNHEDYDSYTLEGRNELSIDNPYNDLFLITPEEELTEFENGMLRYLQEAANRKDDSEIVESTKKYAAELLSLAREQLMKDGYVIEKKAFHDAVENISDKHLAEMSVQYSLHCKVKDGTRHAVMNWSEFQKLAQKFIDIGKAEALKDLPRWREWGNGAAGNSDGHPIALVSGAGGIRFVSALGVTGEKYIMLDDLKKLPGFKEDESHE